MGQKVGAVVEVEAPRDSEVRDRRDLPLTDPGTHDAQGGALAWTSRRLRTSADESDEATEMKRPNGGAPRQLERLIQEGRNPYELGIVPTHYARQVVEAFDRGTGSKVALAGRLRAMRIHGGATFADLHDSQRPHPAFRPPGPWARQAYEAFKDLDLGDIIGVRGEGFRTKRGEISVEVQRVRPAGQGAAPAAREVARPQDIEQRYRRRYLDLTVNPDIPQRLSPSEQDRGGRSARLLDERGLHRGRDAYAPSHPGGSQARPFETYHNTLDMPLYLRIAPELYLKRLLVGGFDQSVRDRQELPQRRDLPPSTTRSTPRWRRTRRSPTTRT